MPPKTNSQDVVNAFQEFVKTYNSFREDNGLSSNIDPFEMLSAMSDKHGRICRQIKHLKRFDPKPNWKTEIPQSITGYIVYALLLIEQYNTAFEQGMKDELDGSIKQHGDN